jgi:hypothetical protein
MRGAKPPLHQFADPYTASIDSIRNGLLPIRQSDWGFLKKPAGGFKGWFTEINVALRQKFFDRVRSVCFQSFQISSITL